MRKVIIVFVLISLLCFSGYSYAIYRSSKVPRTVVYDDLVDQSSSNMFGGYEILSDGMFQVEASAPSVFPYLNSGRTTLVDLMFSFTPTSPETHLYPVNYTIYLWYSCPNSTGNSPPAGLITLDTSLPVGNVKNGEGFSFYYRYSLNGLGVSQHLLIEPVGGMVNFSTKNAGGVWTVEDLRSFQRTLLNKTAGDTFGYLPANGEMKLRYVGKITATVTNNTLPGTILAVLSVNGSSSERNERVLIFATVVVNYRASHFMWKTWHGVPYPFNVKERKTDVFNFVLGDNRQVMGDDSFICLEPVSNYSSSVLRDL